MLPTRLLTPHQAENDYNIKDTYNYMTVQTDIKLPRVHIAYLEDEARWRCATAELSHLSSLSRIDCEFVFNSPQKKNARYPDGTFVAASACALCVCVCVCVCMCVCRLRFYPFHRQANQ